MKAGDRVRYVDGKLIGEGVILSVDGKDPLKVARVQLDKSIFGYDPPEVIVARLCKLSPIVEAAGE